MANRRRVNTKKILADPERREFLLRMVCQRPENYEDLPESEPHQIIKTPSRLYNWVPLLFILGSLVLINLFLCLI